MWPLSPQLLEASEHIAALLGFSEDPAISGRWARPASGFCDFPDIDRDQRLFFAVFKTLIAANVCFAHFSDVGCYQRLNFAIFRTLAAINV
jgi:hypothetical protein